MNLKLILICGIILMGFVGAGVFMLNSQGIISFSDLGTNQENPIESQAREWVGDYNPTILRNESYVQCLVASSDTTPSKLPRENWTEEMLRKDRIGNTKQGHIILCRDEMWRNGNWSWGEKETDPKRFIIVRIPKSEFNESWTEQGLNYSKPLLDEETKEIVRYETSSYRRSKLDLTKILSSRELTEISSIEYNSKVNWSIAKEITDVEQKIEEDVYDENRSDLKLHGSSGTFSICSSGCDYSSLSSWEAAENADLTGTGAAIANITGGFEDTTTFAIDGWTTTEDDYILITTHGSARHNGVWNDSAYRFVTDSVTNGGSFTTRESYTTTDGVQISSGADGGGSGFLFGNLVGIGNSTLKNSIVRMTTSGQGITRGNAHNNANITNNIIYNNVSGGTGDEGILLSGANSGTYDYVVGNTIYGFNDGIELDGGSDRTYVLLNNVVFNNDDDFDLGSVTPDTFEYQASDDGDGSNAVDISPGGTESDDWDFSFVNISNFDFRIRNTSSRVYNVGGDASFYIIDDIQGDTRPQDTEWDIGADELVTEVIDNPPQWFDNSTNSTTAGTQIEHRVRWTDDTALDGYIFSFDNGTGTFVNDSFALMTGTSNWSNVTKLVNYTEGTTIQWKVWANDSTNQFNVTNTFSYSTTSADSCPYTSGNWDVECSDNCAITSDVDVGGNNITISGTGTFTTSANITGWGRLRILGTDSSNICRVRTINGGGFR